MKKEHLIILVDLFSDIGNRFIGFFLVDLLIFKCEDPLLDLVLIGIIQLTPSIIFSPMAGVYVDKFGADVWLIAVNIFKCLLISAFLFTSSKIAAFSFYLLFISASLFVNIGHLSLISLLIPKNNLLFFKALNERIAIIGNIMAPLIVCQIIAMVNRKIALGLAALMILLSALAVYSLPNRGALPNKNPKQQPQGGSPQSLFLLSINLFFWEIVF